MAFRGGGGVDEDIRVCSISRAGEGLDGMRGGKEGCGVDVEVGSR